LRSRSPLCSPRSGIVVVSSIWAPRDPGWKATTRQQRPTGQWSQEGA
jgi:hypothetical protein